MTELKHGTTIQRLDETSGVREVVDTALRLNRFAEPERGIIVEIVCGALLEAGRPQSMVLAGRDSIPARVMA
ncbi:MAG: hypothetical protein U1G07_11410 [Verrucomicrobiota bacterium]